MDRITGGAAYETIRIPIGVLRDAYILGDIPGGLPYACLVYRPYRILLTF